jgi:hypothetical protein
MSELKEIIKSKIYTNTTGDITGDGLQEVLLEMVDNTTNQALTTTYAELKQLRDNSQLLPGTWYRITDYETIISGEDVQSAGHPFDILVLATDVNVLSEDAKAVHSERDTEGYFAASKLEAWELKYCLDNDTMRFAWASYGGKIADITGDGLDLPPFNVISIEDTTFSGYPYKFMGEEMGMSLTLYVAHLELQSGEEMIPNIMVLNDDMSNPGYDIFPITTINIEDTPSGKGVIWEMEDEYGNRCGYDFKNIQFKRNLISSSKEEASEEDCRFFNRYIGLEKENIPKLPEGYFIDSENYKYLYTFSMILENGTVKDLSNPKIVGLDEIAILHMCRNNKLCNMSSNFLNNNVFVTSDGALDGVVYNNTLSFDCENNTFVGETYDNTLGSTCRNNTFGAFGTRANTLDSGCNDNTFGFRFENNKLYSDCSNNIFGDNCYYNILFPNTSKIVLSGDNRDVIIESSNFIIPTRVGSVHVLSAPINYSDPITTINFEPNVGYIQFAAKDSQGNFKIWNPADLVQ